MKKVDLPTIPYGAVLSNTPIMCGRRCTSFRFFRKDVETIARTVHGDVRAHVREKEEQRRRKVNRRLKIRKHADVLDRKQEESDKEYHQSRTQPHRGLEARVSLLIVCAGLDLFQNPDWNNEYDSDVSNKSGYGRYGDIHERFCNKVNCGHCVDKKRNKYSECGDTLCRTKLIIAWTERCTLTWSMARSEVHFGDLSAILLSIIRCRE